MIAGPGKNWCLVELNGGWVRRVSFTRRHEKRKLKGRLSQRLLEHKH